MSSLKWGGAGGGVLMSERKVGIKDLKNRNTGLERTRGSRFGRSSINTGLGSPERVSQESRVTQQA